MCKKDPKYVVRMENDPNRELREILHRAKHRKVVVQKHGVWQWGDVLLGSSFEDAVVPNPDFKRAAEWHKKAGKSSDSEERYKRALLILDGQYENDMPNFTGTLYSLFEVDLVTTKSGFLTNLQSAITPNQQIKKRDGKLKLYALVIGNSNYKSHPLKNPKNDADDMSVALKYSGFDVIDLRDASLTQLRAGVRQFGDRLLNYDVGLVYYSGHGIEVKGKNYFVPVNADIQREDEVSDQSLDVSLILEKMTTAGKGVNILIVDACRDDPFGRSFRTASRGLANMDAPSGTIIAYATSPGKVASDGDGRNSPYTKNLLKAMQQPNKPIEQVFKEVRRAVQIDTKNQQTPWENTSLSGDFYFKMLK